ncbi:MAG: GNAT family N-acetyltransferase [Gemmatimonadaceae bacterium]|nr:GNAT family N-acetyltransferase [Gemmatimonadaceae bacterium]
MNHTILHEERERYGTFFIEHRGDWIAEMSYSRANPSLVIINHTEVDESLSGQGVGRQLLDALVAWARSTDEGHGQLPLRDGAIRS